MGHLVSLPRRRTVTWVLIGLLQLRGGAWSLEDSCDSLYDILVTAYLGVEVGGSRGSLGPILGVVLLELGRGLGQGDI